MAPNPSCGIDMYRKGVALSSFDPEAERWVDATSPNGRMAWRSYFPTHFNKCLWFALTVFDVRFLRSLRSSIWGIGTKGCPALWWKPALGRFFTSINLSWLVTMEQLRARKWEEFYVSCLAKPLAAHRPSYIWRSHQQLRYKGWGVGCWLLFATVSFLMLLHHGSSNSFFVDPPHDVPWSYPRVNIETRNKTPCYEGKEPKSPVECDGTQTDVLVAH